MSNRHLILAGVVLLVAIILAAVVHTNVASNEWNVASVPAVLPLRHLGPSATAREVRAVMQTDGAVVLDGRATKTMVAAALDELKSDRMAENQQSRFGGGTQLWKNPLKSDKEATVKKLADDPLIMEVAEQLRPVHGQPSARCIGNEVRLLMLSPGYPAGGVHRDVTDSSSIPLDAPLRWGMNVIWAVDDFTEENGATRFVVGSHSGRLSQGHWNGENEEAELALQVANMSAGSAVLYYASTLHASGENRA